MIDVRGRMTCWVQLLDEMLGYGCWLICWGMDVE